MDEEVQNESVGVKVGEEDVQTENDNVAKRTAGRIMRMPDGVFNGFCLLGATIIMIITMAASPTWNLACYMSIMAVLTASVYVALRKITGRRAAPDWLRDFACAIVNMATYSEEEDNEERLNNEFDSKKYQAVWNKVKKSDNQVDLAFIGITVVAALITFSCSRYWNWFPNELICVGVCMVLYMIFRALTGRFRILSAEENMLKHPTGVILACGTILVATGALMCFTEFGGESDDANVIFRAMAPCALALGLANIGLGLASPNRLSNLVFLVFNLASCISAPILAWIVNTPRSIDRDYYYDDFFNSDLPFLSVTNVGPICLRKLGPSVIFATTSLIAIMLTFSIISFTRREEESKCKKKEIKVSKILVGVCGIILLAVSIYKIWNMSITFIMPGPMSSWRTKYVIDLSSAINCQLSIFTSIMAASYLAMRCPGKLEVLFLMAVSAGTLASDYVAISQYDPRHSLKELETKLADFKGCPSESGDSYCYNIKGNGNDNYLDRECLPADKICDGHINIRKQVMSLSSSNCNNTSQRTAPGYYDDLWIRTAADEVFCPTNYEQYTESWFICAIISMIICSFIILTSGFMPSYDGIRRSRLRDRLVKWKPFKDADEQEIKESQEDA